jgi:DNA-binding CsgD family transcriptional regulator
MMAISSTRLPVVGRRHALAQLLALLDNPARDDCLLEVLYGEPGQGKSTMLDLLADNRRRLGGRVVSIRGRPGTGIAYAALHSLLRDYCYLIDQADDSSAHLLRSVLSSCRPPDSALAMCSAVTAWFDCLAPDQLLLVVVDDVDLVDEDSLRVLMYAASRDRSGRIGVVMSAAKWTPLLSRVGVHELTLDDLDYAESRELIDHFDTPPRVSSRLIRRLGGNPLALTFAARTISETPPADAEELPLPSRLTAYVRERTEPMPTPLRHLLEVAAVTGEARIDKLVTLCDQAGHMQAMSFIREAEDAELIDANTTVIRWRRPWMAEAVIYLCPQGRRERLLGSTSVPAQPTAVTDASGVMSLLTPAERRVARHASTGLTTRQVARELDVSEKTVDAQLQSIYRKLSVRSRSQLVVALTAPVSSAAS